jgi:signal transduction histidine kinase
MASRSTKATRKPVRAPALKAIAAATPRSLARQRIRILLLEDDPRDAELERHTLQSGGLAFQLSWVDTKTGYLDHLTRSPPDLILSDYSLPTFDGYSALKLAQEKCPDVPFIFVTGTLGEEVAIETLKKGATDYVLKHRLARLVPAVNRALREARQRAEARRTQERLRESHEQLRTLSVYLQHVREEERIRISREVHDELGQALTGLKLQLIWLISRLPSNLRAVRDKAQGMARQIDHTIESIRRIATELRPGVLDNAGLPAAIEWQASQFQAQTGIVCRVRMDIKSTVWDQDLNTAFFRIFQETLTNIVRHADANSVDVRLVESGRHLVLTVSDDGCGVSEAEIHNTKSIGLLGMVERASLLGGNVHIGGVPGKGTTVTVSIPRPPRARVRPHRHENPVDRRSRAGAPRS